MKHLLLTTGGVATCTAAAVFGADITAHWINDLNGGSVWTDTNEWTTSNFPDNGLGGLTYEVLIDAEGSDYVVEMDIDPTIERLTIGSMQATLRVDGHTLILNEDLLIFSPEAGEATLEIVGGGVVGMTSGVVAVGPAGDDAHGTVIVEGAGSKLMAVQSFDVGPAHPVFQEFGPGATLPGTYQFISAGTIDEGFVFNVGVTGIEPARVTLDIEAGTFSIAPELAGDLDGNGLVNFTDVLLLLGQWGSCGGSCPPSCPGDLDLDCDVDFADVLMLVGNWSV